METDGNRRTPDLVAKDEITQIAGSEAHARNPT